MSSCRDLRDFQNNEDVIASAFGKLISGKEGYKATIEKRVIPPKCVKCGRGGEPEQKFCPQCGGQMKIPLTNCPECKKPIDDSEKFCTNCGQSLDEHR